MGKNMQHQPSSPQSLSAKERRILALRYRIQQHASLRDIAKVLKVSHQTIKNDLDKALQELHKTEMHKAKHYRLIELQRLENASYAIFQKVLEGDLPAIDEYRKLSESRRKLLGLDMPASLKVDANVDAEVSTNVNTEIGVGEETMRFIQRLRGDFQGTD